jgi:prophage antirepressor-like protein
MLSKKLSRKGTRTSKRKASRKGSRQSTRNSKKKDSRKGSRNSKKKESFFMDIFNNIIKYNDKQIFIIFDKEGDIWFKLKDILTILDYDVKKGKNRIIINDINKKKYNEINYTRGTYMSPLHPDTYFINESGLYELLTKSNKPIAKVFMNKYLTDIMPTIRKTGKYILKKDDKQKLDKINAKLNNYKKELEHYSNKYNFDSAKVLCLQCAVTPRRP